MISSILCCYLIMYQHRSCEAFCVTWYVVYQCWVWLCSINVEGMLALFAKRTKQECWNVSANMNIKANSRGNIKHYRPFELLHLFYYHYIKYKSAWTVAIEACSKQFIWKWSSRKKARWLRSPEWMKNKQWKQILIRGSAGIYFSLIVISLFFLCLCSTLFECNK